MSLEKFKRIDFQLDWANRYLIGEEVTAVENGDVNGRSIRLQITNMGSIEDLSSYSVVLYWKHTIAGNTGMNSFKAVDPVNGIFEVVLSPEMLIKPGLVQGNIAVINGTTGSQMLITSRLIHIQVEGSIMAFSSITAADDYSTLKEIVMLWKELPKVVGEAVDYLHTLTDQVVADAQEAIATSLDQQVADAIHAGMPSKAEDSAVVHNTGSETIGGTKTFTAPIVGSLQGNAATATHSESATTAEKATDFEVSGNLILPTITKTGVAMGYGATATVTRTGNRVDVSISGSYIVAAGYHPLNEIFPAGFRPVSRISLAVTGMIAGQGGTVLLGWGVSPNGTMDCVGGYSQALTPYGSSSWITNDPFPTT